MASLGLYFGRTVRHGARTVLFFFLLFCAPRRTVRHLENVFPGGITVNSACVYGPSHRDDETFWELVKSRLDLRNSPGGKMILGDYNVSLNFSRDTNNYLTDPHKKARIKINQWLYNGEFVDAYDELHPGKSSYT